MNYLLSYGHYTTLSIQFTERILVLTSIGILRNKILIEIQFKQMW